MADQDWITTREAAEIAGTSQDYIRILIREGKITAKKMGWSWMVDRKSLEEYKWKSGSARQSD